MEFFIKNDIVILAFFKQFQENKIVVYKTQHLAFSILSIFSHFDYPTERTQVK